MAGTNGVPSNDGELTEYTPDPATYGDMLAGDVTAPARNSGRWNVLYINGMNTIAREHQTTARQLATIANRRIKGIYNQTGTNGEASMRSFAYDIQECIKDYLLPVGRTMPRVGQKLITFGRQHIDPNRIGRGILAHNLAAQQLFTILYGRALQGANTIVVCHSQGNLITANVLWVLMRVLAPNPIRGLRVLGLASPSPSWPHPRQSGLSVKLYVESADPVPILRHGGKLTGAGSPATSTRDSGESGRAAHAVDLYLARKDFQRDLMSALRS